MASPVSREKGAEVDNCFIIFAHMTCHPKNFRLGLVLKCLLVALPLTAWLIICENSNEVRLTASSHCLTLDFASEYAHDRPKWRTLAHCAMSELSDVWRSWKDRLLEGSSMSIVFLNSQQIIRFNSHIFSCLVSSLHTLRNSSVKIFMSSILWRRWLLKMFFNKFFHEILQGRLEQSFYRSITNSVSENVKFQNWNFQMPIAWKTYPRW